MPRDYAKAHAMFERSLQGRPFVITQDFPHSRHRDEQLSDNTASSATAFRKRRDPSAVTSDLPYTARVNLPPTPPSHLPLEEASSKGTKNIVRFDDSPLSAVNSPTHALPTPDPTPPSSADHFKPQLRDDTPLPSPYTESFTTAREDPTSATSFSSREQFPYVLLEQNSKDSGSHQGQMTSPGLRNLGWGMARTGDAHPSDDNDSDLDLDRRTEHVTVLSNSPSAMKQPSRKAHHVESLTFLDEEPRLETSTSESAQSSWLEMSSVERFSNGIKSYPAAKRSNSDSATTIDSKESSIQSVRSTIVEAMIVDQLEKASPRLRHVEKKDSLRERARKEQQDFQIDVTMQDVPVSTVRPVTTSPRLVHKTGRLPTSRYQPSETSALSNCSSMSQLRGILPDEFRNTVRTRQTSSMYANRTFWDEMETDLPQSRRFSAPHPGSALQRLLSSSSSDSQVNPLATFYSHASSGKLQSPDGSTGSRPASVSGRGVHVLSEMDNVPDIPERFKVPIRNAKINVDDPLPVQDLAEPIEQLRTDTYLQEPSPPPRLTSRLSPMSLSTATDAQEVSHATAVSIFPHNNESLLVVQSHSRQNSRSAAVQGASSPPAIERNEHVDRYDITGIHQDSFICNYPARITTSPLHAPPSRTRSLVHRAREYSGNILQPLRRLTASNKRPQRRHTTRRNRVNTTHADERSTADAAQQQSALLDSSPNQYAADDAHQDAAPLQRGRSIRALLLPRRLQHEPSDNDDYADSPQQGSSKRKRRSLNTSNTVAPSVSVRASARRSGR